MSTLLDEIKKYKRICWYPSAGGDFRDLLYLSKDYFDRVGLAYESSDSSPNNESSDYNEEPFPDLFIHTDLGDGEVATSYSRHQGSTRAIYFFDKGETDIEFLRTEAWSETKTLFRGYRETRSKVGKNSSYRDNKPRTNITITPGSLRQLDDVNIGFSEDMIRSRLEHLPYLNRAFIMNVTIKSVRENKEKVWNVDFIYAFCENTYFMRDIILKNDISLDYVVQIRYGESMGGSRLRGSWIRKCLDLCKTQFFIANERYIVLDERFEEDEKLIDDFFEEYDLEELSEKFKRFHSVSGEKWSDYGEVIWLKRMIE